jgi:hypothetical protein
MAANDLVFVLLMGTGATALTDLWVIVRERLLDIPRPNFGHVGRWIGHMARGRVCHRSITAAPPVRGEVAIGWSAHYLIGVGFSFLLPAIWGSEWMRHPTPGPALMVGLATVAAPFFVMQPAMGAGIAASRTPRPAAARIQSLLMHAVFGLGLYAAGTIISLFPTGG